MVSQDTGEGLFEPRDTDGIRKKLSQDTGFENMTGCGIWPNINTGYEKELLFLVAYGIDFCSETKYSNLH